MRSLLLLCLVSTTVVLATVDHIPCAEGSFNYGASCYWFNREEQFTFVQAKMYCAKEFGATLWVPECSQEWEALRDHVTRQRYTWIGARATITKHGDTEIRWMTNDTAMNETDLPFLIATEPYGITDSLSCGAYFGGIHDAAQKVAFFPCDEIKFYTVCEVNHTIATIIEVVEESPRKERILTGRKESLPVAKIWNLDTFCATCKSRGTEFLVKKGEKHMEWMDYKPICELCPEWKKGGVEGAEVGPWVGTIKIPPFMKRAEEKVVEVWPEDGEFQVFTATMDEKEVLGLDDKGEEMWNATTAATNLTETA